MDIAIRPAIVPQDYVAIAAVLQAESREWGATAEELAHDDAGRDPRYYWATLVAEAAADDTPLMVGVAFIGQDTLAQREGAFEIDLRVRPDWQGHGVGKALHQAALAQLAPLAPQELTAMVWQAHPRSARFLLDRGFVETWQRIDSYLDVAGFDWTPYAGLEERVRAQGIQITTYGEQTWHLQTCKRGT